jgi:lipopolysaccharide export system permease protein
MTILDRMLFVGFVRAYVICLVSTLSLYIIVDLFTNIDDFVHQEVAGTRQERSALQIVQHVSTYYGYRSIQYYDRLCEALALLAAMFTVAWSQRSNEIIPLLSAGVSVHRFLRPVLLGAALALALGVTVQELVIPRIANVLVTDRGDADGTKELYVQGCYDPNKVHIEGFRAFRRNSTIERFYATLPVTSTSELRHLAADTAQFVPFEEGKELSGGWLLTGTTPNDLSGRKYDERTIKMLDGGRFFLWVDDATFDRVTQGQKTQAFVSTNTLYQLMQRTDAGRMNTLAVTFHMRITRGLVGLLLVFMGLSIILRDQTRHVFISAGLCLLMCAVFFGVVFAGRFLGNGDYVSPPMAAWLPVLIFGPFAIALYDAIHT